MDFKVRQLNPAEHTSGCLILPVFGGRKLPAITAKLDAAMGGAIKERIRAGDISGRTGSTWVLTQKKVIASERVLLVGLGREKKLDRRAFVTALEAAGRALLKTGARNAASMLHTVSVKHGNLYWKSRQQVEAVARVAYRFNRLKSRGDTQPIRLRRFDLIARDDADRSVMDAGVEHGTAIAAGVSMARDLGNLPGNICTPSYLAEQAVKLGKAKAKISTEILDEADMESLRMGSLLSVSRGSSESAKLIVMRYGGGKKNSKPVVLIGKGVTFDSGGISIKPGQAMDEMKFDMCGAAGVFGCVQTVAALGLPINVVALVPATENLPDGNASKPGDIVTSMSGRTIEVLNTDAEGRLILCDALSYAQRFDPDVVIDIATLTGACIIALGHHASGLMANDDKLAQALLAAGESSWDRAWRLPIWESYAEQLKSNFADLANIGGRSAGAITAACFLSKFAQDYRWAHLDIAGTAWFSGRSKGATGRPVSMLVDYLLRRCDAIPQE